MGKVKRLYLCNGLGCEQRCAETMTVDEWKEYDCHHTAKEEFAFHKARRQRKFDAKTDSEDEIIFIEREV